MHLLDKKTITLQKSAEREVEIREGAKLARKIDELRSTYANEEANLAKFRMESISRVKYEIEEISKDKDTLIAEIEALKVQERALKAPPDSEWEVIENSRLALESLTKSISEREEDLLAHQVRYAQKAKELALEEQRIADLSRKTREEALKAKKITQKAFDIVEEMEGKKAETEKILASKVKQMAQKEASIALKEREVEMEREHLAKESKLIINKTILLEDREATLEREYARLNRQK